MEPGHEIRRERARHDRDGGHDDVRPRAATELCHGDSGGRSHDDALILSNGFDRKSARGKFRCSLRLGDALWVGENGHSALPTLIKIRQSGDAVLPFEFRIECTDTPNPAKVWPRISTVKLAVESMTDLPKRSEGEGVYASDGELIDLSKFTPVHSRLD